jgi:hypothetical protein
VSKDVGLSLLAVALLTGVVLACGSVATPTTTSSALVEFTRTGGFAGVNDHLTINTNRQATLTQKSGPSEFVIDQQTYDQLKQQLDQAGFASLKPDYPAQPGAADLFTYTVVYGGRTVRAQDTAVPASLQPAISTLNGVVQAHGNK